MSCFWLALVASVSEEVCVVKENKIRLCVVKENKIRVCVVKENKISRLSVNQLMPNTNATGTAVNGSAQIPADTDKLVVTIPEDLPLDVHERSLLAKGVNFIPTTSVTDEFQVKEDNEKFFRRVRLKAHFHETSEDTHNGADDHQLSDTIATNSSDTDATNANQLFPSV